MTDRLSAIYLIGMSVADGYPKLQSFLSPRWFARPPGAFLLARKGRLEWRRRGRSAADGRQPKSFVSLCETFRLAEPLTTGDREEAQIAG